MVGPATAADSSAPRLQGLLRAQLTMEALPSLFITQITRKRFFIMLYTVAVVLVLLWLLGTVSSNTMSGFVHILLVIAIIVVLVRVIGGRKAI